MQMKVKGQAIKILSSLNFTLRLVPESTQIALMFFFFFSLFLSPHYYTRIFLDSYFDK